MSFKPEEVIFHREAYLDQLIEMRPKDYAPLLKKEVIATADYCHRNPNPYTMNDRALVSFVVTETDVRSDVQKAVNLIGGFEKSLEAQDRILIKPNFNSDDPPPGSTSMDFLEAVIDLLRESGYDKIKVGEGSGRPWVPTAKNFESTGLASKMAEMNVPLLDFDQSEYIDVPLNGDYLDVIAYPKDLENFDKIIWTGRASENHIGFRRPNRHGCPGCAFSSKLCGGESLNPKRLGSSPDQNRREA